MSQAKLVIGDMHLANSAAVAVICGRFNSFIVDQLEAGCVDALQRHGVSEKDITLIKVPGAFELPVVAQKLANSNKYEAIITLGAVIRGSTPHFEYVSGACANGVMSASTSSCVPVVFGVLTVDTIEQAIERAGTKAGNKGIDAAMTAIEMITVMRQL